MKSKHDPKRIPGEKHFLAGMSHGESVLLSVRNFYRDQRAMLDCKTRPQLFPWRQGCVNVPDVAGQEIAIRAGQWFSKKSRFRTKNERLSALNRYFFCQLTTVNQKVSLVPGTTPIAGPQVHDARVAAICRDHGVRELWTSDRDFSRFPQLTVVNPLVA